jgi:hypothetical protein
MNASRIVLIGVAAGALAAWWAAASTASRRPIASPVRRTTTAVEIRGAELAAEITRLRERLRPTTAPQAPSRNLFEFSRSTPRRSEVAAAPARTTVTDTPPPAAARPALRLVGIAEDTGPDGVLRTAIISLAGQLFFAKPGDPVTDRYQVARISGDAAELTDLHDRSTLTLVLK